MDIIVLVIENVLFIYLYLNGGQSPAYDSCKIPLSIFYRRILEWFLKDHVTLNNGIMMQKIQLCIMGINNILNSIKKENTYIKS